MYVCMYVWRYETDGSLSDRSVYAHTDAAVCRRGS